MLKSGMIIAERYEILGKIGTGGMADVYKAKDHKLNRSVAVKVLKPEFREDKTFIKKFKSEAQAAAGLTHANIVNVYDVGDDEGVYYIVMELIEGITLKEYISKKGKLSVKEATSIAIQVSMGLEAAHSHGIVHRDVKPQNIIISTDGKVKVTDFGIARAASSNTISSNVMGSVHYSSPEQVRGGYSDEKSDIYSLGITIYEMITGRVPFDGDTTVAIAIKHLQEEMVPPSAFAPELPYSLEQIIYKCTQKSVDRRYQKMEDVIADLKHSLIDPQGDFVKLPVVDTEGKTKVISDEELGEIKSNVKHTTKTSLKEEIEEVVRESEPEEEEEEPRKKEKKPKKKKRRAVSRAVTIIALILGAAALGAAIWYIANQSGLITQDGGGGQPTAAPVQQNTEDTNSGVLVPDLTGKTEEEAKEIANSLHIGIQLMGEEASAEEKGRISRQIPAAGAQVEENTTLQYYVSKGSTDVVVPALDSKTGIEAEQILKDLGLVVQIQREYSEMDYYGNPQVEPGYVSYVSPESGTVIKTGDTVTLTISRGIDYGANAEMPNVVGMQKNEALTTLGKFINIQVAEEQSSEIPAGEVMAQSVEAYTSVDPDQPLTITVSTGNIAPASSAPAEPETVSESTDTAELEAQQAAAAAGEIWKCTQRLNVPDGYRGGPVRLQLVQDVAGSSQASTIVEGTVLEFPYQLDITGAPGVSEGTLYISEEINGSYLELGSYPITFEKV